MNDELKRELIYFAIRMAALVAFFFLVALMVVRAEAARGRLAYYESRYGAIEEAE